MCGAQMTLAESREKLEAWWAERDAREVADKTSQGALLEFMRLYETLEPDDRGHADQVIVDWIQSENERKRFDALAMVDRFRIRAAVGQLRREETELAASKDHTAPYELAKVRRILLHIES